MRAIAILACLLAAGCDEKVSNPTDVQPVKVVLVDGSGNPVCAPFKADLSIDVHLAKPSEFTSERVLGGYRIEGPRFWQESGAWRGYQFSTHSTLAPGAYKVRVKVEGCLSEWQAFTVTPNPDASGVGTVATLPPTHAEWSQCRENNGRQIVDETFDPPFSGPYSLTVRTEDKNHRAGYQVGQIETLKVETNLAIGFTQDIPDNATWTETIWENLSGPIRVRRDKGSVLGVCVTVRQ